MAGAGAGVGAAAASGTGTGSGAAPASGSGSGSASASGAGSASGTAGQAAGSSAGTPAAPSGPPSGGGGDSSSSGSPLAGVPRRALVIAAAVLALAVVATVLGLALRDDSDQAGKGGPGGDKNTSAGGSGGQDDQGQDTGKDKDKDKDKGEDGKDDGEKDDDGKGEGSEPGEDAGEGHDPGRDGGSDGGSGIEDTVTTYRHSQGFSIGLPKGWKYTSTSAAGARFEGPDGQKLLVGWTSTPKDNPVADWRSQEQYMERSQYHRIRIEKVGFRDWETADWEFTYVDKGVKYRSIDRGFVVGPTLGYALMYTAKDADWDTGQRRDTWKVFTDTFTPKKS
ncbi:serine/threonine protein kinase [Streptomyces sp. LD120]|uniref:Serine/threonine protein kinase n=1 Tax=Streptomyces physcomitrii TaxID=2724184 RepID=A0ABX1GWX7_9ACTN|nr:serine/threonine protein kinase [Streptomyces physcomitrii]